MSIEIKRDEGYVEISGGTEEIVGTDYAEILPTQPSVNLAVVKGKLASALSGQDGMTCWISGMGRVYLLDGHHTFVACRMAGTTARIKLKKFGFPAGDHSSWKTVSWADFVPAKEKLKQKV